ncbi:protein cordon-bleu isoform X2 [Corythoichthys intestinalis]|uniref:protein cordon-bleu isoform X2 n=1 Tax=Corythoichthys intestinalis TaxID=161448 RepID=UPI0025A62B76|nr:protein cordon-bleu isoform X2 [Corythoichthys intestinalis]
MSMRRMKTRAPPPPLATHHIFTNSVHDVGGTLCMETKENMMRPTVNFKLTSPQGFQTSVTEDGSKPLMDLLVDLCGRYRLNPALHTLELLSPEGHSLGFKPNVLLGSLDVASVLIKEKSWEEIGPRRSAPRIPEKASPGKRTVRLMVNYHSSQKAVVRVNPLIPLQALIPVICEKCEFDPSCVQLLKDSVSRQKLPLDKSLTQLGIKELYVLDRSFVLQPKMGSTPALNYSESISASTNSLDRGTKKGLLGLFHFGRKKSRSETSSLGMEDSNDKIIQNEERCSALSAISAVPNREDQLSTTGTSRSVMNVYRTSPKYEIKKRRAPAPPPAPSIISMEHNNLEEYQMGSESESQQRRRKAPAPPASTDSIPPDSYGASTCIPIPVSQSSQKHSPALCTKMAQSPTISSKILKTMRPQSPKPKIQPQSLFTVAPKSITPSLSNSIAESQVLQDSSSKLCHSLDHDLDTDDTVSLTSSAASGSVHIKHPTKHNGTKLKELDKDSSMKAKVESGPTSSPISKTPCESVLNRKTDEIENKRRGTGSPDLTAPPKPRRSPAWEHRTLSTPPQLSLYEPTKSSTPQRTKEKEETASQTWFHSIKSRDVSVQASGTEAPEAETLSLGNGSSGSSLPDQGYAASEGMADGEDSGLVSTPSDTQPTSPDGSLLFERSCVARRAKPPRPIRDLSSDSDEGCATWGSKNSQSKLKATSTKVSSTFQEKYKWLHQAKTDPVFPVIPGVPMSIVDLNIPVTAIDEVLEEYKPLLEKNESTVLRETNVAHHKGSESVAEWHKKNNSSTDVFNEKNSIVNAKSDQYKNTMENGTSSYTKEGKKEDMKEASHRLALVKPFEPEEKCTSLMIKSQTLRSDSLMESNTHFLQEDNLVLPKDSQRSLSTEKVDNQSVFRSNASSPMLHRKVTCNPTSRFGMKTFTVVPSKPSALQSGAQSASASSTVGAIKIDEQGNIMKYNGPQHRVGDATESGITRSEECPLIGKAKAFWSSSERQDCSLSCRPGVTDKEKASLENIESSHTTVTSFTANRREPLKTQPTITSTADSVPPKETSGKINETMHRAIIKNKPQAIVNDISVPESIKQPQSPFPSFLKPTRRTSSQYVASAINKYGPMGSTKHNMLSFPSQSSPLTQNLAFHTLGHSMQVNPRQSSKISLTDKTFNTAGLHDPCHARSMSDPEFVSESQKESKEDKKENRVESTNESSFSLGPVSDRIKHFQPSVPTQIAMTEREIRDVKDNHCKSPIILRRNDPQPTAKPQITTRLTATAKSEPSRTMSDSGVIPGSPPVNIFGPVKKFKPVVCRSIEKDTSLHSNLMEAIQAGGGKDRLRKISSGARSRKETEENERAALLAAIRAQNSTGRLRKTKSGAAAELERFRLASQEDQRTDGPSSPSPISFTCTSPVTSSQPPSMHASLPPFSPFLHQSKPSNVTFKNANALKNPALAREAVMEAIRSGTAAENLKKVAVPTKTVQVNGRLGTMHPTSSSLPSE